MSKKERETHIWGAADEDHYDICTADKRTVTALKNRGWKYTKKVREFYWFKLPRKALSIRSEQSVNNPKKRGKGGLNK